MTAAHARVTVALPTWNREQSLKVAIESVLAQTLIEFELVVLDNASTDGTAALMAGYADDPRVTYLRRPENIGHRPNQTEGLARGTAPYVMVLHDDEEMSPDNLARKAAFLDTHPAAVMVHGGFRILDTDGQEVPPHRRGRPGPHDRVDSSASFLRRTIRDIGSVHSVSSVLMRRSAVAGDGFYERDAPADDVALWLRLGAKGQVGYLAEALTVIRVGTGWSSGNDFMDVTPDGFFPTMLAVRGGLQIRRAFLRDARLPRPQKLELALETRLWAQRQLVSIIRRRTPGLRPWPEARTLLAEAIAMEPSLAASPLLALAARPYAAVVAHP